MSRKPSHPRVRRALWTGLLVSILLVGTLPSILGVGAFAAPASSARTSPGSTAPSVPSSDVRAASTALAAASPSASTIPSSSLWTQAWSRPSSGAVLPALAPTPLTYSQATAIMVANASGFDGGNWSVAFGGGIASPLNSSLPASTATGNCSVTWIATPTSSIFVPPTPTNAPAGTANFNFFFLVSANVSDTTLVGTVVNGTPVREFTFATSACPAYSSFVNPVGPGVIDSPLAVAAANAAGGSTFLASHANVTEQWLVVAGQNSSYFSQPPFWSVNYSTSCGASFQALIDGLSGLVATASTQSACTYRVTFNETGLATESLWSLTWNNTSTFLSTNTSLSFVVANGTYFFQLNLVHGYNVTPVNGTLVVSGSNLTTNLTFSLLPGYYIVRVNETGLPSGTPWLSDVYANYVQTTVSTVAYAFQNGTWYYFFSAEGYAASPSLGQVVVAGADVTVNVTFSPLPRVTFVETGLPLYTSWSVTFNGSALFGYGTTLSTFVANGNYSWNVTIPTGWNVTPANGTVTVSGSNVTVQVAFALAPGYYTVTFDQTGLATFAVWGVAFVTSSFSTTFMDFPLVFTEPNGSYNFTAMMTAGFFPTPANGTIVVNGTNVTQTIVYGPELFSVTFTETGLAPGSTWSATAGTTSNSSTGASVVLDLANGTYNFSVEAAGYTALPESGTIVVNGTNLTVPIVFAPVTYTVTFTESGLPGGTSWSVTFGGTTQSSTSSSINFTEPNLTATFTVTAIAGFTVSPATGSITVAGANATQAVTFTVYTYTLTITESGLPTGQSWSATIGGVTHSSTTTTITFNEPNGTVSYTIVGVAGFTATPPSGSVTIAGAVGSASVVFTLTKYTVTFTETGLPSGTNWSVTANGTTLYSTTATITFTFPNATYYYTVGSVSGYSSNRTTDTVTVNGQDKNVGVAYSASSAATGFLGLPGSEGYYLVGGIVALVVVLAIVAMVVRRRSHRRRGVATVDDVAAEPPVEPPAKTR